jgi:hypothetical protein
MKAIGDPVRKLYAAPFEVLLPDAAALTGIMVELEKVFAE